MLDTDCRHMVDYNLEKTARRLHEPFPWLTGETLLNIIYEKDRQMKKGLFREPVEPDALVRPKEVQRMLGISSTWFWDLLSRGVLPRVRLAKNAVRIPLSAVHAYIEARKAEALADSSPESADQDASPGSDVPDRTAMVSTSVQPGTAQTGESARQQHRGDLQ
jgi:predicted DNA-binding transcriptional regulator AlpA